MYTLTPSQHLTRFLSIPMAVLSAAELKAQNSSPYQEARAEVETFLTELIKKAMSFDKKTISLNLQTLIKHCREGYSKQHDRLGTRIPWKSLTDVVVADMNTKGYTAELKEISHGKTTTTYTLTVSWG